MKDYHFRIYYEDTDAQGVVYYANYLKFFERARTEYLREVGYEQMKLMQEGIIFIVRSLELKLIKPAKLDDSVKVRTELSKLGKVSIVVKSVIVILILASLVSWMIIFERWIYIKKVNQEFFNFETRFWSDSGLEALLLTSQEGEHEPIGAEYIFQVGYLDYKRLIAEKIDSDTIISSVQRNMQAALTKEQSLLEKHLPFLATIASVSPYIGLFGTVWGIMNSFRGLAGSSQATLSAVAPGISEALIATAIGLFAAIPALIAYNKYISDSDRLISSFEGFKEEFSSVLHRDMQSDKK